MPQRPVLLQALTLTPFLEKNLAETYEIHRLPPAGAERDAFLAAHGADAALLAALPNLKVISSFGVDLDKLPVAAAAERGIPLGYTPDVLNDCVADLGFGLLLAVARRIPEGRRWASGCWTTCRRSSPARPCPARRN